MLHFRFSDLKVRTDGFEAALNMLATGVIFLGAEGDIVLMNRMAEDLLRAKNGLSLVQGKLCGAVDAESKRLRGLIVGATETSNGRGLSPGGTVFISRSTGRPLSVTVAPLRNVRIGIVKQPKAVLFVTDPDQSVQLPADLLQRCYGLTVAEARLTMVLLEGHSLKEASELCSVTQNTAKSQLKSVFAKTHVQRQAQLIRLLLNTTGVARPQIEAS
jgi:DNA-binding CsgD family transcriptional regulator